MKIKQEEEVVEAEGNNKTASILNARQAGRREFHQRKIHTPNAIYAAAICDDDAVISGNFQSSSRSHSLTS